MTSVLVERLLDPLAWLSAITAVVAVWIAYQQHRATRANLRLALYEKRYAVYGALKDFLSHVLQENEVALDQFRAFAVKTAEVEFLFDDDVNEYLDEVRTKAVRIRYLRERLGEHSRATKEERSEFAEEENELLRWFVEQMDEFTDKFTKYLRFEEAF